MAGEKEFGYDSSVRRTRPSSRQAALVVAAAVLVAAGQPGVGYAAPPEQSNASATPAACRCERFDAELARVEALFASRGDGVTLPLDPQMTARFRERVDAAYVAARCLAACDSAPEHARNRARVLLAHAAFKTEGLPNAVARERLAAAVDASARCIASEPENLACHLWHASARGILARDSWNPLNVRLPRELLDEFRTARGGAPPGRDLLDGAATRAEAALLLRAPSVTGGDTAAALRLTTEATTAPRFACAVANRLVHAEALGRSGTPERAIAELHLALDGGLPDCGQNRYENLRALEDAARCLQRLEAAPATDPGWGDDCR